MRDLNDIRPEFLRMLRVAGEENQLGAVETPTNPRDPCWCRSGRDWEHCHKDRETLPRIPFGQGFAERMKLYSGPCQHPSASARACSTPSPIRSHSIQRAQALAQIAEDGHVYSIHRAFNELDKRQGQVDMDKVGVGTASTFPGFCNRHDTELFRPVEQRDAVLDKQNGFLLSYRATTYATVKKVAEWLSWRSLRQSADNGREFARQSEIQNLFYQFEVGAEAAALEGSLVQGCYGIALRRQALAGLRLVAVTFDRPLPFLASSALHPTFDFRGVELQEGGKRHPMPVAVNITHLGSTQCATFGWFGGWDCPAGALVRSFQALPDSCKAARLFMLAVSHLENLYCRPTWWDSLRTETRDALLGIMLNGMHTRSPSALIAPEGSLVTANAVSMTEL